MEYHYKYHYLCVSKLKIKTMAKKKKTTSYDPIADLLGLPKTNYQKKKKIVSILKKTSPFKEYKNIFEEILKSVK